MYARMHARFPVRLAERLCEPLAFQEPCRNRQMLSALRGARSNKN
jgi:hypothetical protein